MYTCVFDPTTDYIVNYSLCTYKGGLSGTRDCRGVFFVNVTHESQIMREGRRGTDPEIPSQLKTRNPELKKTRNPEVPKFEKRIIVSRKGQSRNPELKNTRSRSPDKGPILPQIIVP